MEDPIIKLMREDVTRRGESLHDLHDAAARPGCDDRKVAGETRSVLDTTSPAAEHRVAVSGPSGLTAEPIPHTTQTPADLTRPSRESDARVPGPWPDAAVPAVPRSVQAYDGHEVVGDCDNDPSPPDPSEQEEWALALVSPRAPRRILQPDSFAARLHHLWIPSGPVFARNLREIGSPPVALIDPRGRRWDNVGPRKEAAQRLRERVCRTLDDTEHIDGESIVSLKSGHVYLRFGGGGLMHPSACDYTVPCTALGAGLHSLQSSATGAQPAAGSTGMGDFDLQVSISGPQAPAPSTAYQDTHYPNSFLPFYRSVGKLRTYDSEGNAVSGGTATVIAAKHVAATAAHVFFRDETWKAGVDWDAGERIKLWTGYDGTYPPHLAKYYGSRTATWLWIPAQWLSHESYYRDWAMVALSNTVNDAVNPVATIEFYGIRAGSYTALMDSWSFMTSYPDSLSNGGQQYQDGDEIRRVYALSVRHKCYSYDGSSGGALVHWLENPVPGPYVVAINAGNRFDSDNEHWNIGARMTSDRADAVKDFAAWSA